MTRSWRHREDASSRWSGLFCPEGFGSGEAALGLRLEVFLAYDATEFKYVGCVQLNSTNMDDREGDPGNRLLDDLLVPSLIPVEPAGGNGDNLVDTDIYAKSARINLGCMRSRDGDERISNACNSRNSSSYSASLSGEVPWS